VATADAAGVVGRVLNAGTGAGISVGDLASRIAQLMGREVEVTSDPSRLRPDASEVRQLICDASELQARTRWRPTVTIEAGLQATIDWYRQPDNLARYPASEYVI
jgi:UDP-glucose 4-epimerase